MMDSELLSTCSALGYLEDDTYYKDPDCIDTVKCLIKYLRNEDSTCDTRNRLGAAEMLQSDLIPILRQFPSEKDLFQTVLRLTVNMTQPTLLCFGGKLPKDTVMHHHFLDVMSYNQSYKEAFANDDRIWKVFAQKIYDVLETEWEDRLPEDGLLVERILVLIRNLLHVPSTLEDNKKTADDMSVHDKLLWQMHVAGIDSLLLYLAGSTTEQEWSLHVIEIICLFLKEQSAAILAKTGTQRTEAERRKEGNDLLQMRKVEEDKNRKLRANMMPRHSRFGGTYLMQGVKGIADDRDVILHHSVRQCNQVSFDEGKSRLKKAKNRRALVDDTTHRRSTLNIRKMLKEFCNGILENAYNVLMRAVKDKLVRENAQDHDETYYFRAMSYFLEFNRLSKFRIALVSETMQLGTLHFLNTKMINYYELILTDKEEAQAWGRRMHLALCCYHEFLMAVRTMEISNEASLKESARVLQNNIFYVTEYRDIFLILLRKFDERKQTRGFLRDLIRTTHLFLKMFEAYCKESPIVVQQKIRSKSKKSRKKRPMTNAPPPLSEEERAIKWGEIESTILQDLQISTEPEVFNSVDVFDPSSALSEEMQQRKVLTTLQDLILKSELQQAIKILRTARDVWPEKNIFGSANITAEQEAAVLHEVFLADLSSTGDDNTLVEEVNNDAEDDEEDEESVPQRIKEVELSFDEYLKKFADAKIMLPYVTLLKEFEKNGVDINHCIAKMLHRVAYDMKMFGLLFQVTLFRIFQKIFVAVEVDKSFKELAAFAKWIMVKLYEVFLTNPHVFTEMLFWKNSAAEVYELTEGYGTFSSSRENSNKVMWSDKEKMELLELYNQYKDSETDLVDGILSSITCETRSRRQICQQLVKQGLVDSLADLKRTKGSKAGMWRDNDVDELQRLYEEYAGSNDPVGNIKNMMSNKKSKKGIIEKLLSLGLVADRKQLYKKRNINSRSKNQNQPEIMHFGAESSSEDDAEDESNEDLSEEEDFSDLSSLTDENKKELVNRCCSDGLEEALLWIKKSLENTVQDRREFDDVQTVPIVPFTETQENAMNNKEFKKMLRCFHIQPPANEQEMFWRIPASLDTDAISHVIDILTNFKRKRSDDCSLLSNNNGDKEEEEEDVIVPAEKKRKRALIEDDED